MTTTGRAISSSCLIGAAPTPELVRTFEGFLDAIDERRPWDFDFWVSLAPSTNFNNGTARKVVWIDGLPFLVDGNTRQKSGIGLRGGTNGSYQFRLGEDLSLVTAAGINDTDYEGDAFDDLLLSQTVELRRKSGWTELWLGGIAQERWSGDAFLVEPRSADHDQAAVRAAHRRLSAAAPVLQSL